MYNPNNFISSHSRHSSKLDDLLDFDPFATLNSDHCFNQQNNLSFFPCPPPRDDGPLRRSLSKPIRNSIKSRNLNRSVSPISLPSSSSSSSLAPSPTSSEYSLSSSNTYVDDEYKHYRPSTPPRLSSLNFTPSTPSTPKTQKKLLSPLKLTTSPRRPQSPTKQKFSQVSKALLSLMQLI